MSLDFSKAFEALTGNPPFPWQAALYERFCQDGDDNIPKACNLPTGLGKTSVIAIWLIALANKKNVPRRLVYVVNRRTVVDQTTEEVEKYQKNLAKAGIADPLAISTLRGQFADNREWSADPSRPAVICGTVDMIGSRLLFSGYGVGFKGKPLHAGFLGQDALLVHDEAHLEPAFQKLIEAIESEQKRCNDERKLRVMELTATTRSDEKPFELTEEEKVPPGEIPVEATLPIHHVWRRLHSKKALVPHDIADEKKELVPKIVALALAQNESSSAPAVLIFVRTVEAVGEVVAGLKKGKVDEANIETLTGTMRGLERELMASTSKVFARFKTSSPAAKQPGTVYLVCTSAGEVGVDISADHMVCDLSPLDSMAQRFGRVNRYGFGDARIDVVHPASFETKARPYEAARELTVQLLGQLSKRSDGHTDANPTALGVLMRSLTEEQRKGAFAPEPTILPVTDILFDAWALTTIRDKLPGRPMVDEYLNGVEEKEQYDTTFAWREEVALLSGVPLEKLTELLDEFPLKPYETLRIPTFGKRSAFDQLEAIAEREVEAKPFPVWVIEPDGELTVYPSLKSLLKKNGKDYAVSLAARTVVLLPKAGGLTSNGTLDGKVPYSENLEYDVAGTPPPKVVPLLRLKAIRRDEELEYRPIAFTEGWPKDAVFSEYPKLTKPALRIDIDRETEADEPVDGVIGYIVLRPIKSRTVQVEPEWPALSAHLVGVQKFADGICAALNLDPKLAKAISLAAAYHDLGKYRPIWQRGAGSNAANSPVAKTLHGRPPENLNRYRHELGSMVDTVAHPEYVEAFNALDEHRDLALHLIATHHGRGRPHFPAVEASDNDRPETLVSAIVCEVPGRFARLQRTHGRWGLAYLESLLRAADALESRRIEAAPLPKLEESDKSEPWPPRPTILLPYAVRPNPKPSITVAVDPTNPGQFFACCGLLELADRLWPGAEGWFVKDAFRIECEGTAENFIEKLAECSLTNTMTAEQWARLEELPRVRPKTPASEAEKKVLESLVREAPIRLHEPFELTIDWFTDVRAGGSRFKTWAGMQSIRTIATSMKEAIGAPAFPTRPLERAFSYSASECGLPFNFDSDLGGQGGALDIGFSFDPLAGNAATRIEPSARPFLELMAFVGLQRFRPRPIEKENRYLYCAWDRPLPIAIAAPAACGMLPMPAAPLFEFRLLYRTKYLKSFLPAIPFTGGSDE